MCVTAEEAEISGTRTYVYATDLGNGPVHVCGYQNVAESRAGGNCMFLNFAGTNLKMVQGPERTESLMDDMTSELPLLVPPPALRSRSGSFGGWRSATVEEYGDYTVVLAQQPEDMLLALRQVPESRRPERTPRLEEMISFYMSFYPWDSFALPCFDGAVAPTHPITVRYTPRDPRVLTIPGLDAHDGNLPVRGAPVYRDFRVAFGVQGMDLPHKVDYTDSGVGAQPWAPDSVAGFVDNRKDGPNGEYVMPIKALRRGWTGSKLAKRLVAAV